MIEIPVHWLSYADYNPARGRWDQLFLERLIYGAEGRPPSGFRFVDSTYMPKAGVVVFPAGAYAEHGDVDRVARMLVEDVGDMDWCVLIATSDECQTFPWSEIDLPSHVKLWVMLPRPDRHYPPGTRFIGEGAPHGPRKIDAPNFGRDVDLVLVGQGGHVRRDLAFQAVRSVNSVRKTVVQQTSGFLQGMPPHQYRALLACSWVAPAPSGICSQSSFRAYEALEAGCIPILDDLSPDGSDGFWEMLGLADVAPRIRFWRDLPTMVDQLLINRHENAAMCSSRWQQHKRRMLRWLHEDVAERTMELGPDREPWDQITVIIPTSPVPSNPSLDMIQATVASIRTDLPGAEILITCDGVRDEQLDRKPAYDRFLHDLCLWTNSQFNVWPFIHSTHQHQSGMMHHILDEVHTPFLLYVEHDAPLEGVIPYADILRTMDHERLNSMRFLHEVAIPPGSEHLFLDINDIEGYAPYAQTIQWSQRPHLARTDWYRQVMNRHFAPDARTMIEDVMHGVVQAGTYAGRMRAEKAWERWRMAVYAPEGSWKRSGHANGRADDPKFPMKMSYPDGQRPEGAPPEGWNT